MDSGTKSRGDRKLGPSGEGSEGASGSTAQMGKAHSHGPGSRRRGHPPPHPPEAGVPGTVLRVIDNKSQTLGGTKALFQKQKRT